MKRALILSLFVPVILFLSSCSADMRDTLADMMDKTSGNVYVDTGLVEVPSEAIDTVTENLGNTDQIGGEYSSGGETVIKVESGSAKIGKGSTKIEVTPDGGLDSDGDGNTVLLPPVDPDVYDSTLNALDDKDKKEKLLEELNKKVGDNKKVKTALGNSHKVLDAAVTKAKSELEGLKGFDGVPDAVIDAASDLLDTFLGDSFNADNATQADVLMMEVLTDVVVDVCDLAQIEDPQPADFLEIKDKISDFVEINDQVENSVVGVSGKDLENFVNSLFDYAASASGEGEA